MSTFVVFCAFVGRKNGSLVSTFYAIAPGQLDEAEFRLISKWGLHAETPFHQLTDKSTGILTEDEISRSRRLLARFEQIQKEFSCFNSVPSNTHSPFKKFELNTPVQIPKPQKLVIVNVC